MPDYDKLYKDFLNGDKSKSINIDNILKQDYTDNIIHNLSEAIDKYTWSVDKDVYDYYSKRGLIATPYALEHGNLDKQLADRQSNWTKFGNALAQTAVSELLLGTAIAFSDLFDIITGAAFQSDNDYSNPVSQKLSEWQDKFRNEIAPIYSAPGSGFENGTDFGWWMQNLPNIASSLTLLIPAGAVTKALKLGTKGVVSFTRSSSKLSKGVRTKEEMDKMSKLRKKLREDNFISGTERAFDTGVSALTMRTLENYQEARQVYNDMYAQASETLNNMSPEEYQEFINANSNELDDVNISDRDSVAKSIANKSANRTFVDDFQNLIFDVIQVNALRNPLKYSKNIRTTSAVNRAQRETIQATRAAAGLTTDNVAKRSLLTNAKNFLSDKSKALGIVGAELSEGVEEAVNYIAQQEGMTYGNIMLDPSNTEYSRERRFNSYLSNAELWESAFWGVLGGVTFEAGGSGINRIKNATKAKIKDKKSKNEKTGESLDSKAINSEKVNWREKYETSENKARTSKISKRLEHFGNLQSKLKSIEDNKNPYANGAEINPTEKEALVEKVVDEYISNLAFDAIDSGTWNLTKDYLRDANVQEALKSVGVISDTSGDVENLISKMDNVERLYNDNLIMLNGISARFDKHTPFEYYQIIARENTKAQLNISNIDKLIKDYEIKAEEHKGIFSANLDDHINYKTAVELQSFAYRLGALYDNRRRITRDQNYAKSIEGQRELNDINKEINLIGQHLLNLFYNEYDQPLTQSDVDLHNKVLWTIGYASRFEYDEATDRYKLSNTDEYAEFLSTIASRDPNTIKSFIEKSFNLEQGGRFEQAKEFYKLKDEDIIRLFGNEENSTGSYHAFLQDMNAAFNTERDSQGNIVKELSTGIQHRAPDLNDDYVALASLNLRKIQYNAQLANTTQSVNARINEMHNYMNEARSKAITLANKTIFDYAKKYGADNVSRYIFNNDTTGLENISEKDKKLLDDAILTLNLTSENNYELGRILQHNLAEAELRGILEDAAEEAQRTKQNTGTNATTDNQTGKNSSTSQNRQKSNQQPNPMERPQQAEKSNSGQNNGQNSSVDKSFIDQQAENKQLSIVLGLDNNVTINTTDKTDDEFGFDYEQFGDGDRIIIKAKETQEHREIPKSELAKQELFDGYDPNNPNKPVVTSNPLIVKDVNGDYKIATKGQIEYRSNNNQQTSASISSTGVDTQANVDENGVPLDNVKRIERIHNNTALATQQIKAKINEVGKENVTADNLNQWYDEVKATLSNTSGLNEDDLNEAIFVSKELITRALKAKGFLNSSAKVMSSTIIEYADNGMHYTKEYKDAVSKMIEDYCKDYNIEKIDGKYYVKLEDILRRVNYDFEKNDMSDYMYSNLIEYLNSKEFEGNFVIVDKNLDTVQSESKRTLEDKQNDLIALGNAQRVDIDSLFKNPTEDFIKVFKTLRKGDRLGFIFTNGDFCITKDGHIVGRLPMPNVDENSGALNKINMGWDTRVWIDSSNNKVTSNLQPIFRDILLHKDTETNSIYQTILSLNYNLINPSRKKAVINQLYIDLNNFINNKYTKNGNPIISQANKEDVVEHICNLFNYFTINSVNPQGQEAYINQTLDNWFKKLYEGYKQIIDLKNAYDMKLFTSFEITKITSGELIKNVNTAATENNSNYDKFNQSNSALSDPDNATLMIVDPDDRNNTISSKPVSLTVNQITKRNGSGTIYVAVLKNNRDAKDSYTSEDVDTVIGTSTRVNDSTLKGSAKKIYTAIKEELNTRIDNYFANPTIEGYKALEEFCQKLFYTTSKQDANLIYGVKPNVGLFYGVNYIQQKNSTNGFQLQLNNGFIINIIPPRISTNENTLTEETLLFNYTKSGTTSHTSYNSTEQSKTVLKELFNKIFDRVAFNVSKEHIISDTTGKNNPGLISRNENTKEVSISIPNSSTGKPTIAKFKNFSELVIKGGFIRINTHKEKGSNYRHKGENQGANQILEGKILIQNTTPVEKNEDNQTSETTDIKTKFKDNKISSTKVLNEVFPDLDNEMLKSINDLQLLPNNIIFVADLNNSKDNNGNWIGPNAQMIIGKDDTYVGNKWIDMFNEVGQFANANGRNKQQALRKLIHENIHHKLHKNQGELDYYIPRIKEVYNEFEKWLNDNNIPADDKLRQYLFKDKSNENERLEEFIVEALTSGELIDKLNSIESKVDEHYKDVKEENKTLWQKLIDLIGKLFNWDVKENTLREKTLMIFKDNYENIEKQSEEVKEQLKTKPKFGGLQTRGKINRSSSIIENVDHAGRRLIPEDYQPMIDSMVNNDRLKGKGFNIDNQWGLVVDDYYRKYNIKIQGNKQNGKYVVTNVIDERVKNSEIIEEQKLYTSPSDITKQLDIENKSKYIDLLNDGEIKLVCKL